MRSKKGFSKVGLIILLTLVFMIITIIMIMYKTISNYNKDNKEELNEVKIISAAKKYFLSNEYFVDKLNSSASPLVGYVSLNTLIERDYLTKLIDPKTNKYYDGCSVITVDKDSNYEFYEDDDLPDEVADSINKDTCLMSEAGYVNKNVFKKKVVNSSKTTTVVSKEKKDDDIKLKIEVYEAKDSNKTKLSKNPIVSETYTSRGNKKLVIKSRTGSIWINKADYNRGVRGLIFVIKTNRHVTFATWNDNALNIKRKKVNSTLGLIKEGKRKNTLIVKYDNKKTIKVNINAYMDWTEPEINVIMSAKDSAGNTDVYNNNTWVSKWIHTEAVAKDATSKVDGLYYKAYGATTKNYKYVKASSRNVNAEGISTVIYKACDKAGNCTTIPSKINNLDNNKKIDRLTIKLDRTNPSLNIITYLKDSAKLLTSSNGLYAYYNGNWSNKWVFTKADTYDLLSGVDKVTYTFNDDEEKTGDYKNINVEGISTISYKVCDKAGNCIDDKKVIKLDRTKPNLKVSTYLKNSGDNVISDEDLDYYKSNTWSNKWVFTKASSDDELSGMDTVTYMTTGTTQVSFNKDASYRNINAEGVSTITYKACDKAGNCSTDKKIVKLDRTKPNIDINMYLKNSSNNLNTSTGLNRYKNNTWSNKWVFTKALVNDYLSGVDKVVYTTAGATKNEKDREGKYRNINAEGISKITYEVCDKVGNCDKKTKTIKLDRTKPMFKIAKGYNCPEGDGYKQDTKVEIRCYDEASGLKSGTKSLVVKKKKDQTNLSTKCIDKAGNVTRVLKKVNVCKNSKDTSCGTECTSYTISYSCPIGYTRVKTSCVKYYSNRNSCVDNSSCDSCKYEVNKTNSSKSWVCPLDNIKATKTSKCSSRANKSCWHY